MGRDRSRLLILISQNKGLTSFVNISYIWNVFLSDTSLTIKKCTVHLTVLDFLEQSSKLDDDTDLPCVPLSVHANPQLEHVRGTLITTDTGIKFLHLQQF